MSETQDASSIKITTAQQARGCLALILWIIALATFIAWAAGADRFLWIALGAMSIAVGIKIQGVVSRKKAKR